MLRSLKQALCDHLFINDETGTCNGCGLEHAPAAPITEANVRKMRRQTDKQMRQLLKDHSGE